MILFSWYFKMSDAAKGILMMVIGGVCGYYFGKDATIVKPIGDLFIKLLVMAAIPLLFFNILSSFASLTDLKSIRRVGLKTATWCLATGVVSVVLGMVVTHIIKPGVGMVITGATSITDIGEVPGMGQMMLDLVPSNIFQAFSTGQISQIVVFGVIIGLVTVMLPQGKREPLQKAYTLITDLFRKLVMLILRFAPIGVGALAAATVGQYGKQTLGAVAAALASIWITELILILFFLVVVLVGCRMSIYTFLKKTMEIYVTAVATCSSLATLVVSLEVAEKMLKLPKKIFSFTLPLGTQFNKTGSGVVIATILMFSIQATGAQFTLAQEAYMVLVGLILSEGTGGIPGGAVIVAMIFVKAFNLPTEVAAMMVGVSRLIELSTTPTNVMGDMVGTMLVIKSEGYNLNQSNLNADEGEDELQVNS